MGNQFNVKTEELTTEQQEKTLEDTVNQWIDQYSLQNSELFQTNQKVIQLEQKIMQQTLKTKEQFHTIARCSDSLVFLKKQLEDLSLQQTQLYQKIYSPNIKGNELLDLIIKCDELNKQIENCVKEEQEARSKLATLENVVEQMKFQRQALQQ